MIKGLYEAHLPVRNLEVSISFYESLGLKLYKRGDDIAFFWIKENESWLGLWEGTEYKVNYHPFLRHIAFQVSLHDLENAIHWLNQKGISARKDFGMEPIEPIVFPELAHAAVYFNDPDGNGLELIAQLPVGLPSEKKVYLSEWKNKFKHHHYIRIELFMSVSYSALLKTNKNFNKLFYGQTLSVLGDWFHTVALLTFVYSITESPFMIALTFISKGLPQLLLSPFIGGVVDRFSKKNIMIFTDITRGILVLTYILASYKIEIIFIANICLSVLSCLFEPAKQATLKNIVHENHFVTANSLSSTMNGFMSIMGASLGGIIAQSLHIDFAFLVNSLSYFISAYFIYSMCIPSHNTCNKKKAFLTDIKDGYTYILQTKIILTLILVGISWGLIGGAYQLLLTIYAEKIFHTNIGILYTVQGAGLMIGSLLVNLYISHNKEKIKKAFGWAYFLQGVFFLGFILSSQLIFGLITLLCMRIAGGIIVPLDTTLLQTYTRENMIGKVFSFHYSIYGSLIQLSMLMTGSLLEILSPQMIGSLLATCCIFVSFIWLYLFYRGKLSEESTIT